MPLFVKPVRSHAFCYFLHFSDRTSVERQHKTTPFPPSTLIICHVGAVLVFGEHEPLCNQRICPARRSPRRMQHGGQQRLFHDAFVRYSSKLLKVWVAFRKLRRAAGIRYMLRHSCKDCVLYKYETLVLIFDKLPNTVTHIHNFDFKQHSADIGHVKGCILLRLHLLTENLYRVVCSSDADARGVKDHAFPCHQFASHGVGKYHPRDGE